MVKSHPWQTADLAAPPADCDPALARVVADVAARLRPACAHLAAGEFDRLVLGIACTKRRWEDQGRGIS